MREWNLGGSWYTEVFGIALRQCISKKESVEYSKEPPPMLQRGPWPVDYNSVFLNFILNSCKTYN